MEAVGWDRLVTVEACFTRVELRLHDTMGREHAVKLRFSSEYPTVAPSVEMDLPDHIPIKWHGPASTMASVVEQLEAQLESLQPFWRATEDLDVNTIVIEPKHPARGATQRRIALGNQASLQITLDPRQLHRTPEIRFFGSSKVIDPLNEAMVQTGHRWDPILPPSQNLEKLLGITLPKPDATHEGAAGVNDDCGICYASCATDPSVGCDDERCVQKFHTQCLVDWLRGLPSTRKSFHALFGECPYCSGPISCQL
jgi:E3 ubiquitin-protein ligase FANCL